MERFLNSLVCPLWMHAVGGKGRGIMEEGECKEWNHLTLLSDFSRVIGVHPTRDENQTTFKDVAGQACAGGVLFFVLGTELTGSGFVTKQQQLYFLGISRFTGVYGPLLDIQR